MEEVVLEGFLGVPGHSFESHHFTEFFCTLTDVSNPDSRVPHVLQTSLATLTRQGPSN